MQRSHVEGRMLDISREFIYLHRMTRRMAILISNYAKDAYTRLSVYGPKHLQVFFLCVLRILIFCFNNRNSNTVIARLADTSL